MSNSQSDKTSNDFDSNDGAKAVEVAAMLGDSVINVKHCMDPKGGAITPTTIGMFAVGAACLLSSTVAFAVSVNSAAKNTSGLEYWTRTLHKPAYAFRAETISSAVDATAFAGAGLGLLGVTMGLARLRRERKNPAYRIGTAPGVEMAIADLPESAPASFPLVAPRGDDFVFNYGAGMEGEMIVDGRSTSLAELATHARPSAAVAGAVELPIPARARIRAKAGKTTFLVSAVAAPRAQPNTLFGGIEGRAFAYAAGSLAVHLGIVAFLASVPVEDSGVGLALGTTEELATRTTGDVQEAAQAEPSTERVDSEAGSQEASAAALPEGAAGNQTLKTGETTQQLKDNNRDLQVAINEAREVGRSGGWWGSTALSAESLKQVTGDADLSSGMHDQNVHGTTFGADGGGPGDFGMQRGEWAPGGGCTVAPCGVLTGGRYNTINSGKDAGGDFNGTGGNGRDRKHVAQTPTVTFHRVDGTEDLNKSLYRRYIMRFRDRITYCYEKQLLTNPTLAGDLLVSFFVNPDGTVKNATATGFDATVGQCVAGVIEDIKFPKHEHGVMINYPFSFHPAGH